MGDSNVKTAIKVLREHSEELLANQQNEKIDPKSLGNKEIELLNQTIMYERFYFVIDYLNFKLTFSGGIQRWLGFMNSEMSYEKYLKIIHPAHFLPSYLFEVELLQNLLGGEWILGSENPRFTSLLALSHYDGQFLFVKRIMRPFQFTKNNVLLTSLNEFTVIGSYAGEPFTTRIHDDFGLLDKDAFYKQIRSSFENIHLFSFQEMKILKELVNEKSTAEIASKLQIKLSTVITYYKRIMEKSQTLFRWHFSNPKEVAKFLKEGNLL